jgi:hypothetical protein
MASRSLRTMRGLDIALGLWVFLPWVIGIYSHQNAWNSWIVGGAIAVFALIRLSGTSVSNTFGVNAILGAWIFVSAVDCSVPGQRDRFVNSRPRNRLSIPISQEQDRLCRRRSAWPRRHYGCSGRGVLDVKRLELRALKALRMNAMAPAYSHIE